MANFWDNDPIVGSDTTATTNFWEKDPIVDTSAAPEDKLNPQVQADIDSASNPIDNNKPIDLNPIETPGESKGLFGDFINAYRRRTGEVAQGIDQNINEPFKNDNSGPEWLQRIGDVGSRVGSSAMGMLDVATTTPIATGLEAGVTKPVMRALTPENASPETKAKIDQAAIDTADLGSMALLAGAPSKKAGVIDRSKPPILDAAQYEEGAKQTALAQVALGARNPTTLTAEQIASAAPVEKTTSGLVDNVHSAIDKDIEKTKQKLAKVKAEQAATTIMNREDGKLTLGGVPEDLDKVYNKEIAKHEKKLAKLEAEKQATKIDSVSKPLTDEQFKTNIADPVDNALASGVEPAQIEKELRENLAASGLHPDHIDDIVAKAIPPKPPIELDAPTASKAYEATNTIKANPNDKLVTADEMEKILNGTGTQLSTKFNNDLSPFYGISRYFSKKNGGRYFSGDNVVGDYRLARITNEREQGNKILPGLIGTEDGTVKNIEQMTKEGVVVDNFKVKPYHTIQKEAIDAGIAPEKINEFRLAANALDDYNNISGRITKLNEDIGKLKAGITPENKAKVTAAIKDKTAELKELAGKKTYQGYIDREGNRVALSQDRAKQVFNEFSSTEAGKKYMQDMKDFSGHLVDMRVEAGLLSKEEGEALKASHPFYLSAQRDVENYADLQKFISSKGASTGVQKRNIGESDYTGDPVENTVMNIMGTARSTQRNRERQQMLESLIEHLDDGAFQKVFRESKSDVMAAIQDAKHNPEAPKVTSATDITRTPEGKLENTGNFSVFYNGKRIDLTVKKTGGDNFMLNSLTRPTTFDNTFEHGWKDAAYNTLLGASQIKRNLITTYNPIFSIGSMLRESMGYAFTADAKAVGRANLYKPWKTFTTANQLRNDPELYKMLRQNISPGVLYRDYQNVGGTELVNKVAKSKNFYNEESKLSKVGSAIKAPLKPIAHNLEEFAQYSDIATRARYYNDVKATLVKQGMAEEQANATALAAARRLGTNYQEQGAATIFNRYKALTPFLKTTVNSITKDFNALRYRPQQVAEATGVLAGLVYTVNQYNKQFGGTGNIDPKIREGNIIVKTGTGPDDYVKIPGPFSFYGRESNLLAEGLDTAFTSMAQKIVDTQDKAANEVLKQYPNSNLSADDLSTLMFDALIGQVNINSLVPIGASTGAELAFNRDAFGKQILPDFMKKLDPSEQIMPGKTSQAAIELGKKTGMSPVTLDYIITSNLGGLGDMLLSGSNMIISAAKGKEQPEMDLGRLLPGVDRFSGYGSKVPKEGLEQEYSRLGAQLKQIDATLTKKASNANLDPEARKDYLAYAEKNKELIKLYKTMVEPTDNKISDIYKNLNRLQSGGDLKNESTPNKELLGDPKLKAKIDSLRNEANDAREKVLNAIKEHKDRYGDLWETRLPVTSQTDTVLAPFRSNTTNTEVTPKSTPTSSREDRLDKLRKMFGESGDKGDTTMYTTTTIEPMSYTGSMVQEEVAQDNEDEAYKPGFFEKYTPELRNTVVNKYKDFIVNRTLKLEGDDKYTERVENGKVTPTKFGVTLDTLKQQNPNATAKDVRELTRDKAVSIYKDIFWDKAQVDKAPIGLQDLIFDGNINHGVPGMTKVIQRALNDLGAGLQIDGNMGNKTLNKLDEYPVEKVRAAILARRKSLYNQHPDVKKFGAGWMDRLSQMEDIPKEAEGA